MATDCKKVLLVEDDDFTRYMMKEIISTLGVNVEVASSGDECCQAVKNNPTAYGLVLMDLHMPGMSGIDATNAIRNLASSAPKQLPIIAVTGDVDFHNNARIEQLGMNGYVSKPLSPGRLLSLIDQYCIAA